MKKKTTAFILTAALCLCQMFPAVGYTANADNGGASVEAQITDSRVNSYKPGDKIYVDVSVSPMKCSTFALNAKWDKDCLELTNAVSGNTGSASALTYVPFIRSGGNVSPEQSLLNYTDGSADDVCVFAFSSPNDVNFSGTAVTLEFTVKPNAENGISSVEFYFDDNDPPKNINSENIAVSQSSDEAHDGIVEADITGGVHVDTGITGFEFRGSSGTLIPEFSQDIHEYEFAVPVSESIIPRVEAVLDNGVTADIVQAEKLNDTATVRVSAKRDTIYKIRFVEDTSNKSAAPVIFPASTPVLRNTDIYIHAGGEVYFTLDGTDPDRYSNRYYNYISADDFGLPMDCRTLTVKAISYENGKDPSDIVTAEFPLPDPDILLNGIKVNNSDIKFDNGASEFVYKVNYKDREAVGNIYNISAEAVVSSSAVIVEPAVVSFNSIDGNADEQNVKITVTSAEGNSKVYNLKLQLSGCVHDILDEEDTAGCDSSGLYTTKCRICGKIIGEEFSPAAGHYPATPVVTNASCGTEGSIVTSCVVCGKEISRETIPPTGEHSWTVISQTENHVQRQCAICGISENIAIISGNSGHEHSFNGKSSVISEASCTAEGIKRTYCSVPDCGAYIDEKFPASTHASLQTTETPASCTAEGSRITSCTACGEIVKTEVISALGHSFEFENTVPSCDKDIILTAICGNGCGETLTYVIPRSKHRYSVQNFDETGHWYECSVCGAKDLTEPHIKDTQGVPTGEDGVLDYYCTECEYLMSTVREPSYAEPTVHTHSYDNNWQSDSTKHWKACTECGEKSDISIHTEDGGVSSDGVIKYSCTVCGQLIRTETPEAAHKHSISYSALFESDSTAHWHTCQDCGEVFDYSAHTENGGIVTKDAEIGSAGVKTYSCTVCGYEIRREIIPPLPSPPNVGLETVKGAENVVFTYIDENGSVESVPKDEIKTQVEEIDTGMISEEELIAASEITEKYDSDIKAMYDITLMSNNGIEVQPSGVIKVNIPVPDGLNGEALTVYHREGNGFTRMETEYDSLTNQLSFQTTHFSIYVLAQLSEHNESSGGNVSGDSGNGSGGNQNVPVPPTTRPVLPDDYGYPDIFGAPGGYKNNAQGEDVSSAAGLKAAFEQAGSFIYVGTIFVLAGTAWLICRRFVKKRKK